MELIVENDGTCLWSETFENYKLRRALERICDASETKELEWDL